jgi:hypothetical protein
MKIPAATRNAGAPSSPSGSHPLLDRRCRRRRPFRHLRPHLLRCSTTSGPSSHAQLPEVSSSPSNITAAHILEAPKPPVIHSQKTSPQGFRSSTAPKPVEGFHRRHPSRAQAPQALHVNLELAKDYDEERNHPELSRHQRACRPICTSATSAPHHRISRRRSSQRRRRPSQAMPQR